jgi:hypothetical protein
MVFYTLPFTLFAGFELIITIASSRIMAIMQLFCLL